MVGKYVYLLTVEMHKNGKNRNSSAHNIREAPYLVDIVTIRMLKVKQIKAMAFRRQ